MVALTVNRFRGMTPRRGRQLVSAEMATSAVNCDLISGEMRSLTRASLIGDFAGTAFNGQLERAFRVALTQGANGWALFDDETVDFLKGRLVNDVHERYYWTSETTRPQYNEGAKVIATRPATGRTLGVPRPTGTFVVAAELPHPPDTVTRTYVYTWVNDLGEEGPPSEPVTSRGGETQPWLISGLDALPIQPWLGEGHITHKRLYRTVVGAMDTVDYHFVHEMAFNAITYTDNNPTYKVGSNRTLESEFFYPPPKNLIGIVAHPNGFFVGFGGGRAGAGDADEDATARDIYFSFPYRPHAWSPLNVISTQHVIKGLGVFGTSIIVCTQGYPYIMTGIRPESMVLTKANAAEPCVSTRRGIVSMPYGVVFPTQNGLVVVNSSGFTDMTKQVIGRNEWITDYVPHQFHAARYQQQYIALDKLNQGLMLAPDDSDSLVVNLADYAGSHRIQSDFQTGNVIIIRDNAIYKFNPPQGVPLLSEWISKEFDTPKPVNFGAARIIFESEGIFIKPDELAEFIAWNAKRYAAGALAPVNSFAVNGVSLQNPNDGTWPPLEETKNATQYGPLFNISRIIAGHQRTPLQWQEEIGAGDVESPTEEVEFSLFANGKLVFLKTVHDTKPFRLPSGYKATRWAFRIRTRVPVLSVKIAETGKELAAV